MKTSFFSIAGMAFRNLSRHRVKTVITTLAIAISVSMYIFVDGWLLGINLDSERNIVSYEIGADKIQTHLYFEKKDDLPMYENFSGWETYAEVLNEKGYDSAPRFVFTGTLYSATGSAPMEFNAVDPEAEIRLLRYANYMESGRFIEPDGFEIALGTMAAEKLKTGIPQRPAESELKTDILNYARDQEERDFILSLYEPASSRKKGMEFFAQKEDPSENIEERFILKETVSAADLNRFWNILAEGGRMDVRISTVIDIKAAPEVLRSEKIENDLSEIVTPDELRTILSAYEQDPLTGDFYLVNEDEAFLKKSSI
ncbi:hypothetical protein K7I13_13645 [Brucepastera parasyntrophica]|uniref:hypothetical protein n=1 Tax=Brucepastera parasyntrophica TaxID=2880008 RepID=UPI00210B85FC|nr:hypothetical protein [Brucepastera parasyntrophica]ULQ59497.1 hypothetical protein K7I13_13645 [Brucepastera parasyntrophica]